MVEQGVSVTMDSQHFQALVAEVLEGLPVSIRNKLDNVAITVVDWPSHAEIAAAGVRPGYQIRGLYQGVPQTRRSSRYGMVLPDRITLYRGPILSTCRTEECVGQEVRRVLLHELGHHFGMNEEMLRDLGL